VQDGAQSGIFSTESLLNIMKAGEKMKKVINDPKNVVDEMVKGYVLAYPKYVSRVDGTDVIMRVNKKEDKVALISGGGSGHEPSHAGFLGTGMLDAAVCGAVFTSPTPDQIFAAIRAVATPSGVLLIIKNYSGDVMNFEVAMEMAEEEGIKVDKVIVDDDVAVENSTYTVGRRGIAGTVLVHKIAGAIAEQGATLEEVKEAAEQVIRNTRSMGMALTPCFMPEAKEPSFTLADDEMEIGLGIHGEPGVYKDNVKSADEITKVLLGKVLDDMKLQANDEVVVLINGLGATPLMEMYIVNNTIRHILDGKGIKVYDTMIGEYMTSMEMAGFSVTLLKLDESLKTLYKQTADTPAWKQF